MNTVDPSNIVRKQKGYVSKDCGLSDIYNNITRIAYNN